MIKAMIYDAFETYTESVWHCNQLWKVAENENLNGGPQSLFHMSTSYGNRIKKISLRQNSIKKY
ncbi:hypothetical protein J6590_098587 [Homalodisca vitripennis]|nr:hypothetical protein J6590_098587 [Homalodisca vitripennis]